MLSRLFLLVVSTTVTTAALSGNAQGLAAPPAGTSPLQASQASGTAEQPARATRYAPMPAEEIRGVLERVRGYLASVTPTGLVERVTLQPVTDYAQVTTNTVLARGDFRLLSYEWGVVYAGMLHAAEVTGDARFREYAAERLQFLAETAPKCRNLPGAEQGPFRSLNAPQALDDAGAMGAAFIQAARAGIQPELFRPVINNYLDWITRGQFRLADGTLARNRPLPHAVWCDDLYMSVPALAQMGVLTGQRRYFDDAVKQVLQFHQRLFVKEKGLFMHGWIEGMEPHPVYHWARANGWAMVAMAELLSVLPEEHPQRAAVLEIYRAHAAGLAACQGGSGRWHQLLDRNDTYAETSASAMFVYALARGINRGWLQMLPYGPTVSLGWNAVAAQVNAKGQVENTCVGTGIAFDPGFYYTRPVSPYAAHGYGPVLHAGAEMLTLFTGKGRQALISDEAVQFEPSPSKH